MSPHHLRSLLRLTLRVAFVALGVSACGGVVDTRRTGSADAGLDAAGDIASSGAAPCSGACPDAEGRAIALPRPACPAQEPSALGACSVEKLRCSYGEDRYPYCRAEYECRSSAWIGVAARASYCPAARPTRCSPEPPKPGSACTVDELGDVPCGYDKISCRCAGPPLGAPGDKGSWLCFGSPESSGCPEVLPNIGEGCAESGRECWYDPEGCLDSRLYIVCRDAAWQEGPGPKCFL
jgi:hypothetical protein